MNQPLRKFDKHIQTIIFRNTLGRFLLGFSMPLDPFILLIGNGSGQWLLPLLLCFLRLRGASNFSSIPMPKNAPLTQKHAIPIQRISSGDISIPNPSIKRDD